jgi:hypothetical protein
MGEEPSKVKESGAHPNNATPVKGGCGFGSNVSGRRRRSGGPRQRWCGPGALGRYGGGAKQTRGDGSSPARR